MRATLVTFEETANNNWPVLHSWDSISHLLLCWTSAPISLLILASLLTLIKIYMSVRVSIFVSMIFRMNFGTVLRVWYYLFFILFSHNILSDHLVLQFKDMTYLHDRKEITGMEPSRNQQQILNFPTKCIYRTPIPQNNYRRNVKTVTWHHQEITKNKRLISQ